MTPRVKLIAALDNERGIAKKGMLPWDLPSDRKYFRDHIEKGPVVMGWNTFASNNFKPYGVGKNFVLSREDKTAEGVEIVHNAEELFIGLNADIWVAGGGQVFNIALRYATHLYLTRVKGIFDCDVFFPEFTNDFQLASEEPVHIENGISFRYQIWERKS